tara:strand:+ start:941 stop:1690 length:750 start_codon:yes stop_codon:yes gene_type:complete
MNLTALIIAKNEESKIEICLKSLNFVDNIVVVLDRTTDSTKDICQKFTSNIFEGSWKSEPHRRNFGISKCDTKWIVEIDADEVVTSNLARQIKEAIKTKEFDFYYIDLINFIGEQKILYGWMACLAPEGKFSLFRKNSKKWIKGSVHPSYEMYGKKGPRISEPLLHFMSQDLSELFDRFNRNTSLHAIDLRKQNISLRKFLSLRKIISRFLKCYISRQGFRSGSTGLLIGILSALYPLVSAKKSIEERD